MDCSRLVGALMGMSLVTGCDGAGVRVTTASLGDGVAADAVAAQGADGRTASRVREGEAADEALRCAKRRSAVAAVAALPGAPRLEAVRAALLGRAKAEPVVFLREPRRGAVTSPEVEHYRTRLAQAKSPAATFVELFPSLRRRPAVVREVLLHEGYLYTESPGLAVVLVDVLELRHLFDAPELILERGRHRQRLRRDGDDYRYVDGPGIGEKAGVLVFDRIWVAGEDPGPPLHRAVDGVMEQTGAERIRFVRLTERGALAQLRYGEVWTDVVLEPDADLAAWNLGCERVPAAQAEEVAFARELNQRRRDLLRVHRRVIEAAVAEQLPFDEPETEVGQQDGNLRPQWRWAYDNGWDIYRFNDDTYPVFDRSGRPRVPQVCIDFIVDTYERASGTWWGGRGSPRERVVGRLDFGALAIDNRRSVERFVRFAWEHPQWFDVHELPPQERIPLFRRERFYAYLAENADAFLPGDIVTIFGPRGDDDHYHSFFIVAADPVTGMPTLLAANAGRPRFRTWEQEMRSAPRRSIRSRIRPRLEWLEAHTAPFEQLSAVLTTDGPSAG